MPPRPVPPGRTCTLPLCQYPLFASGLCSRHYTAKRKYGDPNVVLQKQHHGKTLAQRLEIYTKQGPDCWEWIGHRDPNGYGRLNIDGVPQLAHRLAYQVEFGSIPADKDVLHKCDNPPCCRPSHLFLGVHIDNMNDMYAKGRGKKRGLKGVEHNLAKLDEAAVRAIRASTEVARVLAARYGVSTTQISDVRNRKSWKHIE